MRKITLSLLSLVALLLISCGSSADDKFKDAYEKGCVGAQKATTIKDLDSISGVLKTDIETIGKEIGDPEEFTAVAAKFTELHDKYCKIYDAKKAELEAALEPEIVVIEEVEVDVCDTEESDIQ